MDIPRITNDVNGIPTLFADGRPYIALGGEVHNSSSSNLAYMKEQVWPAVKTLNLDTLVVPIAWESVEPQENVFDFTLPEGLLEQAKQHRCRLVLLWFGLWKNGESTYVPSWVKTDTTRFFRAMCTPGIPSGTVSPFCHEGIRSDAKAFAKLMHHLANIDAERTVLMVQVENEVGLLGAERDYCPVAETAFQKELPDEVAACSGKSGGWSDAFGEEGAEVFMAYHYAVALEAVASAGKAEYGLPMYVNAWLEQFPARPGLHPSGGPVARMLPIWKACAPSIDMFAPDIYVSDFKSICDAYAQNGNPLFIPEARRDPVTASNVFYALAHYNAIGFAPFGIEAFLHEQDEHDSRLNVELNIDIQSFCCIDTAPYLARSYQLLAEMKPLLLEYRGTERMQAFIRQSNHDRGVILPMTDCDLQLTYPTVRFRKPESAGIVIEAQTGVFLIAGCNFKATVLPKKGSNTFITMISLEEGTFIGGQWSPGRVLNGDERRQTAIGDMAGAIRIQVSIAPIK